MPTLFDHPNYVRPFWPRYTQEFAARAIAAAMRAKGRTPTTYAVAKALAQALFETDDFRSCYNHNWGNVRRDPKNGPFTMIRGNELVDTDGDGDKEVDKFAPGDPESCFASYMSAEDGCAKWLSVFDGKRYPEGLAKLYDDNVSAYDWAWSLRSGQPLVDGKPRGGYYTDEPHHYSSNTARRFFGCLQDVFRVTNDRLLAPHAWLWDRMTPVNFGAVAVKLGFRDVPALQSAQYLKPDGDVGQQTRGALVALASRHPDPGLLTA